MSEPRVELVRSWRGMPPRERQEARRQRLLEAGLEVFGTAGFRAATVGRICREAELTNRYFYEHFADREAALRAVYDMLVDDAMDRISRAMSAPAGSLEARVMTAVDAYLGFSLDDPRRPRIISVESVGVSPALEERRRSVRHAIAGVFTSEYERCAREGTVVDRPFGKQALALVGAAHELVIDWVLGDRSRTREALSGDIAEVFVPVLRSREH
ncbi:TetR/AcrR family transcriptional regulator [Nocardiopsis sp. MG754419]|uniref:TetR/AcrR family transcriptional regulator n=1 Tax=Nocardiopsis sp. MG754419 TaxID=2259865 RepID=UPI001BA4FAD0|nr:TetR/AcrR family transcriptional regulator [Nocardiopsis sp. MG754419]MBR8741070.1 TetR/AcrR family transcriptional regulator [Nocardiopsis sp. MG754419]